MVHTIQTFSLNNFYSHLLKSRFICGQVHYSKAPMSNLLVKLVGFLNVTYLCLDEHLFVYLEGFYNFSFHKTFRHAVIIFLRCMKSWWNFVCWILIQTLSHRFWGVICWLNLLGSIHLIWELGRLWGSKIVKTRMVWRLIRRPIFWRIVWVLLCFYS